MSNPVENKWMSMFLKDEKSIVSSQSEPKQRVMTASPSLNWALGGGFYRGYTTALYGPEGCLAGDTFIQYEIKDKDGKRQNHKGGEIQHLYKRFKKIPVHGKGFYQRPSTVDSEFFVSSINDEGRVIKNRIVDVVDSGVKPTFKLTTSSGATIVATADHKFFMGGEFKPLSEIKVGESVYVHNNTPFQKEKTVRVLYFELMVKYHYSKQVKEVSGYSYCRVKRCRAVVEAAMNGLSYDQYVDFLNTASISEIDSFRRIPEGFHVHHINEDKRDDRLENLIIVDGREHNREHALNNHNDLRFVVAEDRVVSIEVGEEVQTYDIKCEFPYNNYIANGIVVHNSGKSLISMMGAAALHQRDKEAIIVLISTEMRDVQPERFRVLGGDPDRLLIRKVNTLHDVFDWIASDESEFKNTDGTKGGPGLAYMLAEGAPVQGLIVDSIKGIQGPKEQATESSEQHFMGDISFFLNPALRRVLPVIREYSLMTLFVQQVTMNMDPNESKYVPWKVPGGQALKHFCEHMGMVTRVKSKEGNLMSADMAGIRDLPVQDGHTIRVKVDKANLDTPFRESEFRIHYKKGVVDTGLELAKLASGIGVLFHPLNDKGAEQKAQWVFGDQKWTGFDSVVRELEGSPDLRTRFMQKVWEVAP